MEPNFNLVNLTFCGPSDVAKELALARSVIDRWNLQHGEARGFWVKVQHWSTDCHPALGDRPQAMVNGQIINKADILVAIFWSRFGTPTGVADSGTQEEIRLGVRQKKKVMVYFSDLEPLPPEAKSEQTEKVWSFRRELREQGLCWSFASRTQFERLFESHLAFALNELRPVPKPAPVVVPTMNIVGDRNIQVAGDYKVVNPVVKKVIERRDGSLTPAECRQVQEMIKALVELTTGLPMERAFASWWERLKNRFKVEKYESLQSTQLLEVEDWYREQRAILTSGLKTKAPELWKNARIGSIKKAMKQMNREADKLTYYREISDRLNMKRPFTSLTKLTKTDLERVYRLVLRDAGS